MSRRMRDLFTTVRTEGGLLPPDLLQRVSQGDSGLRGLKTDDYHLDKGTRFNEAINRSWNRLTGAWKTFREEAHRLSGGEAGTGVTRQRWLLPLFDTLGYGRLTLKEATRLDGREYPISHFWNHAPIHLVGFGLDLDRKAAGVAGAARTSPHGLVQDYLNRTDASLWGLVSNGLRLRILRDNVSLTRQAFVEFDLEAMMEGQVFADFALLWLLAHQSRVESTDPAECWLERWSQDAEQQGTRALNALRDGVQRAIEALGAGYLSWPGNAGLRERLRQGKLTPADYYEQLRRMVYRMLFIFVAEDRDLLLDTGADPEAQARYREYYATSRLRRLAMNRRGSRHPDLYRGLCVVMDALCERAGYPGLAIPHLGGMLWSADAAPDLNGADIANRDFLEALRHLARTEQDGRYRAIDYRNLGSEELGSIYESLLELHPRLDLDAGAFALAGAAGSERKTTGSYYTPTGLIQSLLDTALDPVLADATAGKTGREAVDAILDLKVCDPACGSGHFLIAAAHRIAKRLACVRTGDDEPSAGEVRTALRDVIGHCIYGVDLNPMSVELCKVSLWIEALEPGKPLTYLEHRIRCGNSLLGAVPSLLADGIPNEAFAPLEGDNDKWASGIKRRNRDERKGAAQTSTFGAIAADVHGDYGALAEQARRIDTVDDATADGVERKEFLYKGLRASREYRSRMLCADAWCSAFVWPLRQDAVQPPTHGEFLRVYNGEGAFTDEVKADTVRLAEQHRFFHWHLEFPEVFEVPKRKVNRPDDGPGWTGGFDAVLGNPPWERVKLQEREWFASRRPDIADASNTAARRKKIALLRDEDPATYTAFQADLRGAEGQSQFIRTSGRYPLGGRGDVNTYPVFVELMRSLVSAAGAMGVIVPSGIATDDTTKHLFQSLMDSGALRSLYDFENSQPLFLHVHRSYKFCLLTVWGPERKREGGAEFAFFLQRARDLQDAERRFELTPEDIALMNPNTRTCPIFRTRRDAEITRKVYGSVPVLIREGDPEGNPWGIRFATLFHMSNDSHHFRTREEMEETGLRLRGNIFEGGGTRWLPLYEAKMIHHYNHRFGDYADQPAGSKSTQLPDVPEQRLADPGYAPLPRYWVPEAEVEARLSGKWDRGWLMGWRDICRSTDERTVIASVVGRVGVGHTMPILLLARDGTSNGLVTCLLANLSSCVFDYAARQKVGGTHLTYIYLKQLPVLPPSAYSQKCPWSQGSYSDWIVPRVLRLVYTTHDLAGFAADCGYKGVPFAWDPEARFQIRCELDAAFFHLYSLPPDDAAYVLDTFPIVRKDDEKRFGAYRTKETILRILEEMLQAARDLRPLRLPGDG